VRIKIKKKFGFKSYLLYRKHTVDFEFQALLKRHFTRVMYFDATVMDPVDLDRVKVIDRYYTKKKLLIFFSFFFKLVKTI